MEIKQLPAIQPVDLERLPASELEKFADATATTMVLRTFSDYEAKRASRQARWANADELYSGWVQPKFWEGTTVPRASFPVRTVFDQVEAALPAIEQALFSDNDWFQVRPLPGASPQDAQAVKARLRYILEAQHGGYGPTGRSELLEAVRSALLYGQGVIGIEYDFEHETPYVCAIDIRDMFFDPGNQTPWVDKARSVIRRHFVPVEELREWRGKPRLKIPDDDKLYTLSRYQQYSVADTSKDEKAAVKGDGVLIADHMIPDPLGNYVELLSYYTEDRIVMLAGRQHIIYNEENPYHCIPFVVIPCFIYPNRWFAEGFADKLEEVQRVQEGMLNLHLDELTLALQPPRAHNSSYSAKPSSTRWKPGAIFEVSDPKNDVNVIQTQQATTNIQGELEYWERLGEKRTGVNSLAQGVPRPANANRTASGMATQMQGSALRLSTIVRNVETFGIVPLLTKLIKFLQIHEPVGDAKPGLSETGIAPVPTDSAYKPVTFTIDASSTMLSRERLQAVLPVLMQNLISGPLIQGLAQNQMTIHWPEFFRLIQDAAGTSEMYQLVRPMSPQEIQAMQTPPPQVVAAQQKAQLDSQTRLQALQMQGEYDLKAEMIKKQSDPAEMQREAQKLELEKLKGQFELELAQAKLELEKQKSALALQMKQMEMGLKAQEAQQKAALTQFQAQNDFRLAEQRSAIAERQGSQELERSEQEHGLALRSQEEKFNMDRKIQEQKLALSRRKKAEKPARTEGSRRSE